MAQLGRNLAMDLEDVGARAKFMIRDRDSKFTDACDTVLQDAGLRVVTSVIRIVALQNGFIGCELGFLRVVSLLGGTR